MKRIIDYFFFRDGNLSKSGNVTMLLYRIFAALVIFPFGVAKLLDYDNLKTNFFDNPIGIGNELSLQLTIFSMMIAPFFLIIGFQTRFFAAMLAFTMAVATKYHFYDPYGKFCFPLVYLGMYLILFAMGPGKYSLDYRLFDRQKGKFSSSDALIMTLSLLSFVIGWCLFYYQPSGLVSALMALIIIVLWITAYLKAYKS